jgi:hypothetical protein
MGMAITLQFQPLSLPLRLDKTGVARVGGTRVTLAFGKDYWREITNSYAAENFNNDILRG